MLKSLFAISVPIMLQNLLITSLSFVDTLMIGSLGKEAIAAVGVANQMFFIITLFFFGLSSGCSVFLSQFFGAGDWESMRKSASFALMISLAGSILLSFLSFAFPDIIVGIFTEDPLVIAPGVSYLRTVALSYVFSAVSAIFSAGFRSTGKSYIPLLISLCSLSLNAFGNYLLIFGIGPFPRLEVEGAALATLFSRIAECLLLIIIAYKRKEPFRVSFKKGKLRLSSKFIKTYLITAMPILLNECLWSLGMVLYKVAYSSLGTSALATANISEGIQDFFFIVALGMGNGAAIVIGNTLGKGERKRAISYGYQIELMSLFVGILMGILEYSLSPIFASWFNVEDQIKELAIASIRVNSLLMPIRTLNNTIIIGILRGGADTRYSLISEISCVYLLGVPAAFISADLFHLPLNLVYLAVSIEEVGKLVLGLIRLFSKKWANTITEEEKKRAMLTQATILL